VTVYANTREISGKATPNKTIAAFPDVCLSPPSPPAGPIPLPYPITGVASNTTDGTSSVYIRGKEAGKKNGVKYSKVDGNQPATNSFGAGVITHKITGPLKFAAYSFDVFLEKGGAERFMDMTTQNHTNQGNTSPGVDTAGQSTGGGEPPDCEAMRDELEGDRAAVEAEQAAGTPGFQSQALETSTECGTLSSATTSPGGMQYGASNQLLADRAQRVSGRPYPTPPPPGYQAYAPTPSRACNGNPPIVHPTGRHSRHAEMNILNKIDWANNAPSSITFCIDYPAAGGQAVPNRPCPNCQQTIQQVCACVEQIYVCDENNNPEPQCP
jgi:Domain of unknown function (DUF4150)